MNKEDKLNVAIENALKNKFGIKRGIIYGNIYEDGFREGTKWQSNEDAVMTSNAIQRALIKHNEKQKKTVLKNFRNVCGCFHKGTCTVDSKKCTFSRCESLTDLFKE
ncbi:MAG: hypothetical protein H6Q13_3176 [Bacteroidetes bacterium]|nr:hypothetical protein [Bacteroidota bacterium]